MRLIAVFGALFGLALGSGTALAQTFDKPVKIMAPYAPGGNIDVTARIIADKLREVLGTTVIVENKAGASGMIGSDIVARAAPDGTTLLVSANSLVAVPAIYGNAPYDWRTAFTPISHIQRVPAVLVVPPNSPIKTLADFIALGKDGKFAVADSGIGTTNHLAIELIGEANDYVGKSMSGGEIIIKPEPGSLFLPHEAMIIGNTVMYGASGGRLFATGRAGERFCVRNSGGTAVVEGIGDHGCEYMTNGTVVVLGRTGRNFGAGMTGGAAYILDLEARFERLYNNQLVSISRLAADSDVAALKALIQEHHDLTDSPRAAEILGAWDKFQPLMSPPPNPSPSPPRNPRPRARSSAKTSSRPAKNKIPARTEKHEKP